MQRKIQKIQCVVDHFNTFVGTMILSLTKAMHWFETCMKISYKLISKSSAHQPLHLVRHHLHLHLLVASDADGHELGPKHPLLSL